MKRIKKFIEDFREFLEGTNFIDVAIGLLIATAVKDLATQFTSSFIEPIIGKLLNFLDLDSNSKLKLFGMNFGVIEFIGALFTFIIILLIAFIMLRLYAEFKQNNDEEEETELELLKQIRDELKNKN